MTTLERLEKILEERYHVPPDRIALDAPIEALGLDSLGATELLFFIEDEFEIAARLRDAHGVCDEHRDIATASLIEVWIDETERRTWFLYEATRGGS